MGTWEGIALADVVVAPADLAVRVLDRLGLPADEELREVTELAVTTFDAAAAHDRPELLADCLRWAGSRVRARTGETVVPERLLSLPAEVLAPEVDSGALRPDDVAALTRFLVRTLALSTYDGQERPDRQERIGPLARTYLDLVLDHKREAAVAAVLDAVRAGTDVATVLVEVLEPAQKEIGRLWQEGRISVAEEHYCTAIAQLVMTELYPWLFTGADARHRLVAVQAGGSLHEIGLRMVVDLLQHEGWDTTYLGAETDPERVLSALVEHEADVLAVSASMPGQVRAVAALIAAVRSDPRTAEVKVIVGGRPFSVAPDLVNDVGADGWAHDARATVELCTRLMEHGDATV